MTMTNQQINERFGHTPASIEGPHDQKVAETHEAIRARFKALAQDLDILVPDSRQKDTAFTELETASMWFHKALAHNRDQI